MDNFITAVEFSQMRNISKKLNTDKIDEAIQLAQENDLQEMLGDFYFDVAKNFEEADYSDLMNGSDFNYSGDEFIHHGLKKVLADLVFARWIIGVNTNLTPFGAQQKFTQDSNAVDVSVLRMQSKQAQKDASIKFKTTEKYIFSEPDLFGRYCRGNGQSSGFNQSRLFNINKEVGNDCSDVLARRYGNDWNKL